MWIKEVKMKKLELAILLRRIKDSIGKIGLLLFYILVIVVIYYLAKYIL